MDWRTQSIILTMALAFAIAIVLVNVIWAITMVHVVD